MLLFMAGKGRDIKYIVDVEWLRDVYEHQKLPVGGIAARIGCCVETLNKIVERNGIERRDGRKGCKRFSARVSFDVGEATRLYIEEQLPCDVIADVFGCQSSTVLRRLKESGVSIRHHNDTKRGKKARNRIDTDNELILSLYRKKYMSAQSVADEIGISVHVVRRVLRECNEPKKSMSDMRDWNGAKHPRWRPDLTTEEREKRRDISAQAHWREQVYKRDGYTCQKCGDSRGGNFHAHHIEPHYRNRSERWKLSNGITLCSDCHRQYHRLHGFKKANLSTLVEYLRPIEGVSDGR